MAWRAAHDFINENNGEDRKKEKYDARPEKYNDDATISSSSSSFIDRKTDNLSLIKKKENDIQQKLSRSDSAKLTSYKQKEKEKDQEQTEILISAKRLMKISKKNGANMNLEDAKKQIAKERKKKHLKESNIASMETKLEQHSINEFVPICLTNPNMKMPGWL